MYIVYAIGSSGGYVDMSRGLNCCKFSTSVVMHDGCFTVDEKKFKEFWKAVKRVHSEAPSYIKGPEVFKYKMEQTYD